MKTIVLGRKEFQIGSITIGAIDKFIEKMSTMEKPVLDKDGKVDIGDVIHFILLVVYEDENKAFRVGKELISEDPEFITLDQVQKAIEVICESTQETIQKMEAFAKEIRG
nr:MAG TPA: hypothetical protein [Bacteriophage sp.]